MKFEGYLQEIETLVVHLAPEALVLSDMDLHVAEQWFEAGVPLETALAGVRKGSRRLQRLKRPPRGLPLKRVCPDVERERKGQPKRDDDAPATVARPQAKVDHRWRNVVLRIASEAPRPAMDQLRALAGDQALGEERAFVRFTGVSREHYQCEIEALDPALRQQWSDEITRATAAAHAGMSPDARGELVAELVRRRLIAENPVLDPQRFWEEE